MNDPRTLPVEDRVALGRAARKRVPPEAHAELAVEGRPDPARVLHEQELGRLQELVPVRYDRMLSSPFAFYRGAAAVMAADLARTPVSGLTAQLCGDAHLVNFGMFASPERRLVFDVNDFDETFPGPWEWDVKRLATSLVLAGRENGFSAKQTGKTVLRAVRRYQQAMADFAALGNLEVWYARVEVEEARRQLAPELDAKMSKRLDKAVSKARGRDHRHALAKLTEVTDGRRRFVSDPPYVVPVADLAPEVGREELVDTVQAVLRGYTETLQPGVRELVRSFTFVDMARKVVGVGSVGTRCWVVLMRGRDDDDPLFLQVKEAQPSVLAGHLDGPSYANQGERVVAGQRLMQASGDVFLGWQRTVGLDGQERDFYVRQLHDWKGAVSTEGLQPKALLLYGELCAWTLARAHARSGDRIAIAAYLGEDEGFARAVAEFAAGYADLDESDFSALARSLRRSSALRASAAQSTALASSTQTSH